MWIIGMLVVLPLLIGVGVVSDIADGMKARRRLLRRWIRHLGAGNRSPN